ncbi:MAG: PorP/SprF family type IX secretion system membrane protein [Prevotellaceae bacterium]|jgi:type IX secretion system PorP/SprF family membrane protein|nr:PorP/SprF family type IX secretion system membrane protein [Prevotellaceae bacterium]
MKQKLFILVIAGLSSANAYAQSDFDFSQRWFNESLYNPAAVGNSLSTGFFLHTRSQWLGLDGAPITLAGAFDYFNQPLHSGFGATVAADYIGVYQTYNFRLAYAYYMQFASGAMMSFGLSAGVLARHTDINAAQLDEPGDPVVDYNRDKEYTPDFDFGLEYKGAFKFGVTVRHIGVRAMADSRYAPSVNIWAYLSSRFNITRSMSVEPIASFTYRRDIYRAEAGALLYFFKTRNLHTYNDRFWIGAVYRSDHNIALLAGMNLTSRIRIGYSFDYGVDDVVNIATYGTHELFFAYQFNRQFYKDVCCPALRN